MFFPNNNSISISIKICFNLQIWSGVQSSDSSGQRSLLLLHQQSSRLQSCGADCPGCSGASSSSSHDLQHQQQISPPDLGRASQWQPRPHQQLQDLCQRKQSWNSGRDEHRSQWYKGSSNSCSNITNNFWFLVPGNRIAAIHHLQFPSCSPQQHRIFSAKQGVIPNTDPQREWVLLWLS